MSNSSLGLLFLLMGALNPTPLSAQTFTPANPMNLDRANHTATLLGNGAVLVTGGDVITGGQTNTAEIYDPESGTWRYSRSLMNVARSTHSATRLLDGRVLITGGTNPHAVNSTEIFDPATEQFTPGASMSVRRATSEAVRLNDGRVMTIAGRCDNCGGFVTNTVEIFTPGLGTWSPAAPLPVALTNHRAVLLPDGRVLVAGGYDGFTPITYSGVYIYHPLVNSWQTMTPLSLPRMNHTATLLQDGRILIAGGGPAATFSGHTQVEIYDPSGSGGSGQTTPASPVAVPRYIHTATLLQDGKVLLVGGQNGAGSIAQAELYNYASGAWTAPASLAESRVTHTATLLPSGRVLISGGYQVVGGHITSRLASAEIFGPSCTAPTITTVTARPNILWPPNNKFIPIAVTGNTSGGCGVVSCKIARLSSNEPVDPAGDWMITGDLALSLRAKRLGDGNGRTYGIEVQCTDNLGNRSTKAVSVSVPHSQ